MMPPYNVKIVVGYDHLERIRHLIIQYTRSLNRNLDFQKLKEELQDLEKNMVVPPVSFWRLFQKTTR